VKAERLQSAASLLVLRRDTPRMIDGAGPNVEVPPSESATQERVNGMEAQRVSSRGDLPEKETQARTARPEMVEQASSAQNAPATSRDAVGDSARPAKDSGDASSDRDRFIWERNGPCPREAAHYSLAESSKLTCHERALSRRTSRRWFCHTSGVVTGRKLGCTKKNICAILLEARRFLSV